METENPILHIIRNQYILNSSDAAVVPPELIAHLDQMEASGNRLDDLLARYESEKQQMIRYNQRVELSNRRAMFHKTIRTSVMVVAAIAIGIEIIVLLVIT